ncbi:MAG TPA: MFS transporter [Anaerolineae bacterium]|nr:MFS transporter [Anaerolineae bacterium]
MADRLPLRTKLMYGSGDTGFSLTSTIIGAWFLLYLTDIVGLSPGWAAVPIAVGKIWDWINDPLIGYISDRTRSRWGRRRPFLLFGALPYGLAFVLLWTKPPLEGTTALVIYYSAVYVIYELAATFVYMPYFALTPELTGDYDERTALTSYRMFFSIFASILAFVVPEIIIGSFDPEHAVRVRLMAIIFAILSVLPLWIAFAGTREREEFMHLKQPSLRKGLTAAFENRPFLFGTGLFLLTWVAVDILQTSLSYFIIYVVGREPDMPIIMGTIFVTAIFTLPLWESLSRRWGKTKAYIGGIAFWAVVQLLLITLNTSTGLILLLSMSVLAGIGVGAAHVLPWSIIPDAIEWGEWKTGERNEGMFYSLITLAKKITASIAVPIVGVVLEITGYNSALPSQPVRAITGIRILTGPIPAALLVGGIIFAIVYPLDRDQFAQIRKELKARRSAAGERAS